MGNKDGKEMKNSQSLLLNNLMQVPARTADADPPKVKPEPKPKKEKKEDSFIFDVGQKDKKLVKTFYMSSVTAGFISEVADKNGISESKALELLLKRLMAGKG